MELSKKELTYLELYKGVEDNVGYLHPEASSIMNWYYATNYNYTSINTLLTFLFTKDPALLNKAHAWHLDNMLDMVFTLSDVACRYALENPVMPYYLYRMENKKNLEYYGEGGMTTSFKSTSKSNSEVLVFDDDNAIGLTFDTEGFIPYIDVDKIVKTNVFSDEKEILFPPCVQGTLNGKTEEHHGVKFSGVLLSDDFPENDFFDVEGSKRLYEKTKNAFIDELMACQKKKEISDNLRSYCSVVASYVYSHLREIYNKYSNIYKQDQGFTK